MIEIYVSAPGHRIFAHRTANRQRLAGSAYIAVDHPIDRDRLPPAKDVTFHATVYDDAARPGDEIAVHVAINHGAISCDDQVRFDHLPSCERVGRFAMLDVCS